MLEVFLQLPSEVKENIKWVFEQRPRPQIVAVILKLGHIGALDNGFAIGFEAIKQYLSRFPVGNLQTWYKAVAEITKDKVRYLHNFTQHKNTRSNHVISSFLHGRRIGRRRTHSRTSLKPPGHVSVSNKS